MVILSIPEISFQHFRGSDENRRHSKGDFGFRLPLPWAEGVPNPGLPFPVRKVPVQAWEPPAATAKNWQVGLSRTEVQLHPCNKSKRLHRTMLSGYSDHNLDKYMRVRMTVLAVLIMMEDQNLSGTSKAVSFSSPETSCWAWQNISTGVWFTVSKQHDLNFVSIWSLYSTVSYFELCAIYQVCILWKWNKMK